MSQENMELARAQYRRWNAEDFDAWIEGFDPAVEYYSSIIAGLDGRGRYFGHAGMRRFIDDYTGAWERFSIEPLEFIDAGAHVVVSIRTTGRGRASGVGTTREMAHVWTFRDRRAIRHESFGSREEAMKAVGLEQ